MTDEQIIKALEAHISQNCGDCSYDTNLTDMCVSPVMKDALDLIKRQQAEIDSLKRIVKHNDEIIAELEEQNELEVADGGASCHLCLKVHTDKAIKEFAEKLKAKRKTKGEIWDSDIDNLVKEMVGADNAK